MNGPDNESTNVFIGKDQEMASVSLDALLDTDLSEIPEYRGFPQLPVCLCEWEIKGCDRTTMEMGNPTKVLRAVIYWDLEAIQCVHSADPEYGPDRIVGAVFQHRVPIINPDQDMGRVSAFLTDVDVPNIPGMLTRQRMAQSIGKRFWGSTRKSKDGKYTNLETEEGKIKKSVPPVAAASSGAIEAVAREEAAAKTVETGPMTTSQPPPVRTTAASSIFNKRS